MRWNRKQLREHTEKETAALQKQNQENISKLAAHTQELIATNLQRCRTVARLALFVGLVIGFVVTTTAYGAFVSYKLRTPEGTEQLKNWLVFQEK